MHFFHGTHSAAGLHDEFQFVFCFFQLPLPAKTKKLQGLQLRAACEHTWATGCKGFGLCNPRGIESFKPSLFHCAVLVVSIFPSFEALQHSGHVGRNGQIISQDSPYMPPSYCMWFCSSKLGSIWLTWGSSWRGF